MNKMLKKLSKIVFVVCATLLCVLIAGYDVALANATIINNALHAKTYKEVSIGSSENIDSEYFKSDYTDKNDYIKDVSEFCRKLESEGLVLLTNENNALPLPAKAKVSFFAQGSVTLNYGSSGSSATDTDTYGSLKDAFESKDFSVNADLWQWYKSRTNNLRKNTVEGLVKTYTVNESEWSDVRAVNSENFANYGDAAIVTLSRDSGEGFDVSTRGSDGIDGSYLSLTRQEEDLLKGLTSLKASGIFERIIVLLNSAVPIQLDFLFDSGIKIDACLWVGNVGMTGALGIADVFAGDVNPSGRLTDTFCRDNFSSPAMASWILNNNGIFSQEYGNAAQYNLNSSQKHYGVYVEGIYVGYRYYETRYEDYVTGKDKSGEYDYSEVAFPFGHGLSYTSFSYGDFTVTENDEKSFNVSVKVTNTGNKAGREVVQIYLQKPYIQGGVEKASVELVGFTKTGELAAGKDETVNITVNKEVFKSYDALTAKTYVMDAGKYYLAAGTDAHDALNNLLALKGFSPENTENRMTAAGNKDLAAVALQLEGTDTVTFSKSVETGVKITNQFDFADINLYENRGSNRVTYLSRSDWQGTWPKGKVELNVASTAMMQDLSSHKKIQEDNAQKPPEYNVQSGSLLITLRGLDYDHEAWDKLLNQLTYEEMALLISNAAFGTSTLDSISLKETKASDGPTAVTGSVTGTSFPSEGIWASTFDTEMIEKVGDFLAEDARLNGVDTMYAPGMNIHRTPFGGRAHEYFSEDPYLTATAAIAEVRGMKKKGVIGVLKHFAFNDEESARNGICIWLNEQSAREIYLLPFEYAMRPSMGGAIGAMSSFNRAGTLWTGASRALQMTVSREEWNYQGYFITDMASSNGALFMTYDDGIFNGTDLFLGSGSKTALKEWKNSVAFKNRVREATHRVLYVTVNYSAAMNGVTPNKRYVSIMPWWQVTLIVAIVVVGVAALSGLIIYFVTLFKNEYSDDNIALPLSDNSRQNEIVS